MTETATFVGVFQERMAFDIVPRWLEKILARPVGVFLSAGLVRLSAEPLPYFFAEWGVGIEMRILDCIVRTAEGRFLLCDAQGAQITC